MTKLCRALADFLNILEPNKRRWVLSLTKVSLWVVTALLVYETVWGGGLDGTLLGAYGTVWLGYLGRRAAAAATGMPGGDMGAYGHGAGDDP